MVNSNGSTIYVPSDIYDTLTHLGQKYGFSRTKLLSIVFRLGLPLLHDYLRDCGRPQVYLMTKEGRRLLNQNLKAMRKRKRALAKKLLGE